MKTIDLGTLDYRSAWAEQERVHAEVLDGGAETVLLVEHPPVITFGRRAEDSKRNLVASADALRKIGVEVVESDRGGDITFHGPGQLVAYPIVRLADHGLSVGGYVKTLEHAVIETLAVYGIEGQLDPSAIGVWVKTKAEVGRMKDERDSVSSLLPHPSSLAKICALGVRIKRGISLHGIALNVTTDLSYFNLIVPCGLSGRPVTSMRERMEARTPSMDAVKRVLVEKITACVSAKRRNNAT